MSNIYMYKIHVRFLHVLTFELPVKSQNGIGFKLKDQNH